MQKLTYVEELTYTFHLTQTEHIRFVVHDCKPDCLAYDSWATVFYKNNEDSKHLALGTLHEKLYSLVYFLKKSLNQQTMVDEKLIPDIGFLFNELHYKKSMLHETIDLNELYNQVVWSPIIKWGNIQTWLYVNTHGEIVLFLAPVYPFFNCKNFKKNPSYQEWIKTYKPLARRIITKDTAQKWLNQAHDIMNLIETNSAARSNTTL